MALAVVTCLCSSSQSLVRNYLRSINYPEWMGIPIHQGKEKSISVLDQLPPAPEKEMLANFLKNASKWAVIIGYDGTTMRWSDISHNGPKANIEATAIVQHFGID